jgi:hypothetical protein
MLPMNCFVVGDFRFPEKRKAGQIVRPNFDKTPNWYVLSQAPNRGRSCASYERKASLSATHLVV